MCTDGDGARRQDARHPAHRQWIMTPPIKAWANRGRTLCVHETPTAEGPPHPANRSQRSSRYDCDSCEHCGSSNRPGSSCDRSPGGPVEGAPLAILDADVFLSHAWPTRLYP
jgi:hypothetical protein